MVNTRKEEKRLNKRFPYKNPIKYTVMGTLEFSPSEGPKEGWVIDLSNGGMKIIGENNSFAKGVILKVWLPILTNKVSVPVLAEVRWVEILNNGSRQAGLEFLA